MFSFQGKTVVVVGGTSGINYGIAQSFARAGANLAVISRLSCDVRNYDELVTAMDAFKDRFGEFDVLVSGAAGNFPARAMDMSPNAFASVINIDLMGTFHVMKAAFAHLKKPGASVINISAPQSYIAADFQSHVCSAKAGVDMLTRNLAREWGCDGIRVNSVVPGPIEVSEGMNRLAPTKAMQDAIVDSVPLGRNGTHEDIGNCCMFLASQFASYIYSVSMNSLKDIMTKPAS